MLEGTHIFTKDPPHRRVVCLEPEKREILRNIHDQGGHKGWIGTGKKIAERFWWKGMWEDVESYVRSCEGCQRRSKKRWDEELHPTLPRMVWERVGIDVVHMPKGKGGKEYLVVVREDVTG